MVDLIIHHAGQLLTLAGPGARRGQAMGDLGIIADGAVAVSGGRIVFVGPSTHVLDLAGPSTRIIDAGGMVVMPGFVDAHTHLIFAGDRAGEFAERVQGATYLEILERGGGILSTVRATRQATIESLTAEAARRLTRMLAHGTTTAEAKTGYGLNAAAEIKMLAAAAALQATQPVTIVPTFMGAHAVPAEAPDADAYVETVVGEMLPAVVAWRKEMSRMPQSRLLSFPAALFCDVFCDQGAFTVEQCRRVLLAAKALGLGLKIHADEFANLGGARLAAEVGAVSAEHLALTKQEDMERLAEAGVIAVLLPGTTFDLASSHYAAGRQMIAADLAVALGTDLNPGTCYCESMPFMIALACRYCRLTPAEAVCAATLNAAYASGVGHLVGSLEVGKLADLIVLDMPDCSHLAYRFGTNPVSRVIKFGQEVYGGSTRQA